MKIAVVIPSLDPRRGGAEQWSFQFVDWLVRDGHEVHVVARSLGPAAEALPLVLHRVADRPLRRWHAPQSFAAAAERAIQQLTVDVVHDMGYGYSGDVFQPHGGTRAGSLRQNLLLVPRGRRWARRLAVSLLPRYRVQRRLQQRQYAPQSRRVYIALSQMVRRDMQTFHNVPDERLRVIYNGVDVARFRPENRRRWRVPLRNRLGLGDDLVLLIIAHNFRLKGLATAILALGRLVCGGSAVRLVVVGKGRPGRYRRLAQRAGCAQHVHFVGETGDTAAYYAAADCYVHPTYYDPCSLVVLEALAAGLPVITSQYNGAGELLTPGREGFVVQDPGDADELAARLQPLLEGTTRTAMAEAARELALRHTLEENFRAIVSLYDELSRSGTGHVPHTVRVGARDLHTSRGKL